MRLNDNGVKLTLKIPVGKPDCNGVMYTTEAIEKALADFDRRVPILFRDNEKYLDGVVLGNTTGLWEDVKWYEDGCAITVNGQLYFAGADLIVNDIKDGVVTDFEIVSFGISK